MERLQAEYGVEVRWTAFPLHPETPLAGRTLEELFAHRLVNIPLMIQKLRSVAAAEGLPFGERTMTYNSRRAQELAKWAEEQGRLNDYNRAVFHAYFADGLNIALPEVLGGILDGLGLDREQGLEALRQSDYGPEVDRDWERSRALKVSAVPTFMICGRQEVGAQPYSRLVNLLALASAAEI